MKWVGIMEGKGLGRRINMVRKDRGFTADRLSQYLELRSGQRADWTSRGKLKGTGADYAGT